MCSLYTGTELILWILLYVHHEYGHANSWCHEQYTLCWCSLFLHQPHHLLLSWQAHHLLLSWQPCHRRRRRLRWRCTWWVSFYFVRILIMKITLTFCSERNTMRWTNWKMNRFDMRWMNKRMEWSWYRVLTKVEQINDKLILEQ